MEDGYIEDSILHISSNNTSAQSSSDEYQDIETFLLSPKPVAHKTNAGTINNRINNPHI